MSPEVSPPSVIRSTVPARLDALGWTHWHRRVVFALGITWILDGLEASLVANLAPTLRDVRTLALTGGEVGFANTVYLIGQVIGALVFGHLVDRFGRKRLFLLTIGLYLAATALCGLAPNYAVFLCLRFFAGAGIGGEYSAINSAIDELVPARIRGQIDLGINGSYWIGVGLGAGLTLLILNPHIVPIAWGWRIVFCAGAVLGLAILVIRRNMPESPRWLLNHGHVARAEQTMSEIEHSIHAPAGKFEPVEIRVFGVVGIRHLFRVIFMRYRRRTLLGFSLMLAQAFFYNSIFFSYGLILEKFHGVPAGDVGIYIVPFAAGNFLGPLLLGRLFDQWGRRVMIPLTYFASGILLLITGGLFWGGLLNATTQTIAWSVVFFVASAAASSAYLTVSELFPVELRGMAIAVFYAFGTLVGAGAPLLFGILVDAGDPKGLFAGYALAASLMCGAAVVARQLGVDAEGKSLEALAD